MKQILYDTANQATVNRAVHSKGKREKGLCMYIWINVKIVQNIQIGSKNLNNQKHQVSKIGLKIIFKLNTNQYPSGLSDM